MAWLPLIILALIQGLTEFLPVSSSGHLVLVHHIFGGIESWDERLILDVAVHVGTLFSVLIYFRKDVWAMLCGLLDWTKRDFSSDGARLNIYVLIASIPVILAGLVLHILKPEAMLMLEVMAWATILFGILLWIADSLKTESKTIHDMHLKDAILIGLAQCLALIPGTSRSGITMTASRFLGYSRSESARFSLLLAIIAISGAGAIGSLELISSGNAQLGLDALIAALLAFISGWIAIALMMKWLERFTFKIFAIYRIILGAALLLILYHEQLMTML